MSAEKKMRKKSKTSSQSPRSPLERKETLHAFLTKTQAIQTPDKSSLKTVDEICHVTDTLSLETSIDEKAVCQDEVVMDSQIVSASSQVLKKASTMLTEELNPYNYEEFAEKLLRYVHMEPDTDVTIASWSILENELSKMFKRTPYFTTLSGCLDPLEKKVVVKSQRVKKDAQVPTKKPEAIVSVDKDVDGSFSKDDSIEKTVQKIKKLIFEKYKQNGKPIEYFRLILHPENFGKTIENILHVSFLVRDGIIKMFMDDNKKLVIVPATKEMRTAAKESEKPVNVQNIISLTFQQWRILVEAHGLTSPMIDF